MSRVNRWRQDICLPPNNGKSTNGYLSKLPHLLAALAYFICDISSIVKRATIKSVNRETPHTYVGTPHVTNRSGNFHNFIVIYDGAYYLILKNKLLLETRVYRYFRDTVNLSLNEVCVLRDCDEHVLEHRQTCLWDASTNIQKLSFYFGWTLIHFSFIYYVKHSSDKKYYLSKKKFIK